MDGWNEGRTDIKKECLVLHYSSSFNLNFINTGHREPSRTPPLHKKSMKV